MFTLTIEDKHGGIADEYSFEEGEFLIGRSHSADIILPSDNVSRRHARLYTVDGRCYIEDLGSANGVFVNGRRIHEVFEIEKSAQVRVGDYYLHVKSDTAAAAEEDRVFCKLHGRNLSVADQVFKITRSVNLVGRGKDCTITIIDPSVSRIHSKLTVERSGALTLEDLKSSNGTFINGERIEVATLNHRDLLRFGNVEFMVEFPDLAPGDGATGGTATGPGVDDLDESWGGAPAASSSNKIVWIIVSVVAGLLLLGGILFAIFGDEITGGTSPSVSSDDDSSKKGSKKGDDDDEEDDDDDDDEMSKEDEIELLVDEGRAQIENRLWERASRTWDKVLKRDPLHKEAQRALNQIEIWKKDQQSLEQARKHVQDKLYGKAARLLREIDDSSKYYLESKEELKRLLETKDMLLLQAESLVKKRDCAAALKLLEEAKILDPRDASIVERIKTTKKKAKRRCR